MPSPICEQICRQIAAMRAEADAAIDTLRHVRDVEEDSAVAENQILRLRWSGVVAHMLILLRLLQTIVRIDVDV